MCMVSLTKKQFETWREFRFMVEETSLSVSRSLFHATGLSGGQFGILSILVEAPDHSMRQQQLANAMRWDRTRLSHQLTRMETRGWIKRQKVDGGVTLVSLLREGKEEQRRTAPILGEIVRARFFSLLSAAQLDALQDIRNTLRRE